MARSRIFLFFAGQRDSGMGRRFGTEVAVCFGPLVVSP